LPTIMLMPKLRVFIRCRSIVHSLAQITSAVVQIALIKTLHVRLTTNSTPRYLSLATTSVVLLLPTIQVHP
jgi:hypothetical protein